MLLIKTRNKADIDEAQRYYWWNKTPQERLAAAADLIQRGKLLYAANPDNPPLFPSDGAHVLKATTPIRRRGR